MEIEGNVWFSRDSPDLARMEYDVSRGICCRDKKNPDFEHPDWYLISSNRTTGLEAQDCEATRPKMKLATDLRSYVYLKVQTSAPLVFPPFFPRRGWVHRCPIENDNLGSIHKTVISQNALFYLNVLIPSWTFLIIMDADIKGAKAEALDNARRMVASYLQVRELRAMATETWY